MKDIYIVYCMMCQNNLLEVKRALDSVEPYVDDIVVVDGGSQDTSIFYLRNRKGVNIFLHPWEDNFSKQRNNYLQRAEELAPKDVELFCLVSDPDEVFDVVALQSLYKLAEAMLNTGANLATFRCISQTLEGDIVTWENLDNYWKGLFFYYDRSEPPRYIGNPHETLVLKGGLRVVQTELLYRHQKQKDIIWLKGARNLVIGGSGPNLHDKNPLWVELKGIVHEVYGKDLSWFEFEKEMMKGNLDQRIKNWMIKVHDIDGFDGASEHRECYKTYMRIFHPEEEPEELRGKYIQ